MSTKPLVFFDGPFEGMTCIFSPTDLERLNNMVEAVWGEQEPLSPERAKEMLPQVMAIVCRSWRYDQYLDIATNLRAVIDVAGALPLNIDYEKCFARGIRVMTAAPGYGPQVAEMALALALCSARGIVKCHESMRTSNDVWDRGSTLRRGREPFMLYGKPVGMIGYGSLARCLHPLLTPFGCTISVYDPWLSRGYLRSVGVKPVSLDELMSTSKVIFVLAVPSVENRALLSREKLELIQQGAVLVLVSRAHVVDFDALTEMAKAGRFKVAVDVYPVEPPPVDHPIRSVPDVILTAHMAGGFVDGLTDLGRLLVDDLEVMVRGLPPRRLQEAQRELALRYASIYTPRPKTPSAAPSIST